LSITLSLWPGLRVGHGDDRLSITARCDWALRGCHSNDWLSITAVAVAWPCAAAMATIGKWMSSLLLKRQLHQHHRLTRHVDIDCRAPSFHKGRAGLSWQQT
jgi:hypothetical protein